MKKMRNLSIVLSLFALFSMSLVINNVNASEIPSAESRVHIGTVLHSYDKYTYHVGNFLRTDKSNYIYRDLTCTNGYYKTGEVSQDISTLGDKLVGNTRERRIMKYKTY